VTWTATEWFRAHWPGPLAFPWLGLGTSLTGFPELVGVAELVGSRGVTFWLALVNGLLAALFIRRRDGGRMSRLAAVLALVVLLPPAWGVWRARTLEVRAVGRVTVVQPNIPEHIKLDQRAALDSTFASLDRLLPGVEPGSVKLVVLPEVTFPLHPKADYAAPFMARVQSYARELGAPIMFGGIGFDGDVYGDYIPFNSVFLMEPQGLTDYEYDKRYLVPVVERMPFLPISWIKHLPYFGRFGVGQGWPLADVDGIGFAPLVCYESTYPEGARTFRREGADILVNVTNDAWYGREPLYARTTALWQHPAHMVMRAIENRMGVARAANTGISLFVDPVGRVYNATALFTADVRTDVVYTTDVTTFYTRYGDLVGNGAALAAFFMVLAAWWMRRRFDSLDPDPSRN
jgi:apolipoprotein N-acyltransferase